MRFTETITIPWRSINDEKPDHTRAVWVRRRPWFVVMWTVWLIWTFLFTVVSGGLFLVFAMNIAFLITLLWIFYTVFCLGATVAVIFIRIRTKRAKTS